MPMLLSLVSPDRDSNTRSTELEAILLTIITLMQLQGNANPVVMVYMISYYMSNITNVSVRPDTYSVVGFQTSTHDR